MLHCVLKDWPFGVAVLPPARFSSIFNLHSYVTGELISPRKASPAFCWSNVGQHPFLYPNKFQCLGKMPYTCVWITRSSHYGNRDHLLKLQQSGPSLVWWWVKSFPTQYGCHTTVESWNYWWRDSHRSAFEQIIWWEALTLKHQTVII